MKESPSSWIHVDPLPRSSPVDPGHKKNLDDSSVKGAEIYELPWFDRSDRHPKSDAPSENHGKGDDEEDEDYTYVEEYYAEGRTRVTKHDPSSTIIDDDDVDE